jgi:chaperonin GroES
MSLGGGDQLARGNVRAQFNPATSISDEKFKEMFGEDALRKLNAMSEADRLKLEEEASKVVEDIVPQVTIASAPLRAIQDRVIVRRVEEEEIVNGILIPDDGKEKPAEGIVLSVGPGKYVDGELQRPTVNVGDRVVFGKFSGAEVKVGFEKQLVLREEDIFGIREIPSDNQGSCS